MSVIIIPRRWTRQPTGPVELNWSHPLALGIDRAIILSTGFDSATKQVFTSAGTKIKPTAQGLGRGFGTGFGTDAADILHCASPALNTGPISHLTQFWLDTTAANQQIFNRQLQGAASNAGAYKFQTGTGSYRYGRHNGTSDVGSSQWSTSAARIWRTAVITNDYVTNTNTKLYENGYLLTRTGNSSTLNTVGQSTSDWIQLGNRDNLGNGLSGFINLYVVFNRLLPSAEALELTRNPWQLFKPISTRIYFDGGASASFNSAWARNRSQVIGAGVH